LKDKLRLAKRIAESGIASRREAERMIESGCVAVDGVTITTPVFFVNDTNIVAVNGKIILSKSEEIILWRFYKPRGVITSKRDTRNRKTVFDLLDKNQHRLLYIGRLDYNSEGLLLFTNNGDLARKMELPETALKRTYRVRIFGKLSADAMQKLKQGVTIDGIKYRAADVQVDSATSDSRNVWLTITISEGKNREIRKIMEHFGCSVNRLIRIGYGPFKLDKLKPGEISMVHRQDAEKFLKNLADASGF
jgi:23S rRNA pseudouridine2605 synthase